MLTLDDTTRVYTVALDVEPDARRDAEAMLSDDERARAQRFHFERDRCRYIVTRAALRAVLGTALGIDAASVRFQYTPNGKPLVDEAHRGRIHFNVSHSDTCAVIA